VLDKRRDGARIEMESSSDEDLAACLKQMIADGLAITEFHRVERKLEDAFVDMVRHLQTPPPLPVAMPN
jgi:ABC-2 type transport system ATP-binding protein